MFKLQTSVQKPSGPELISEYMAGDPLKLQPSAPLWNHLSPPLASYCFSLAFSTFHAFILIGLFFFLAPELYAPKPYSAFEIVPGPLYSSKLRAMAQLLIDKPIEKLPVEGQGFMFLQPPPPSLLSGPHLVTGSRCFLSRLFLHIFYTLIYSSLHRIIRAN